MINYNVDQIKLEETVLLKINPTAVLTINKLLNKMGTIGCSYH